MIHKIALLSYGFIVCLLVIFFCIVLLRTIFAKQRLIRMLPTATRMKPTEL